MEEFIDGPVKFYSSGMYVRLGFAVAVNVDPDILVVDEVLAVGDERFQRKCIDRVKLFQKEGRTIMLVTHSPDQVRSICDRAVVLSHGNLMTDCLPGEAVRIFREGLLEEDGTLGYPRRGRAAVDPHPRFRWSRPTPSTRCACPNHGKLPSTKTWCSRAWDAADPVLNPLLLCSRLGYHPIQLPAGAMNFMPGLQQAFGSIFVFSGEYIWKYTHNAYDFSVLGATPITFPIEWDRSKIPGYAGRVSVPNYHGFSALMVFSSVAARFFTPQIGGAGAVPSAVGPFRIDHDEKFNTTAHMQYQPWKRGPWLGFNWRYDSGLVAGPAPCAGGNCANGPAGDDNTGRRLRT